MKYKLNNSLTAGVIMAAFTAVFLYAGASNAFYKIGDDEKYLKIGGLLQGHILTQEDASPDQDSWSGEFYMRRMRLILFGQINSMVNFFVETDNPNFGKNGDWSVNMFIQDAWLELNLHEMIQLDFGMILLPFSHHGMQGATSLLAVDYHSSIIKYPKGSHKVWRDYGLMLKGLITKWVEYRFSLSNGVRGDMGTVEREDETGHKWLEYNDPRNPDDAPRITGRLTFNVFEPEGGPGTGGFFYDGIYLKETDEGIVSTKKVLSIGGSIDWIKDANVTWDVLPTAELVQREVKDRDDYIAAAGDVFWDIPFGDSNIMSFNGQVNFYYYYYGDRSESDTYLDSLGDAKQYTGTGLLSEIGFRYDAYQPLIIVDWYNATDTPDDDTGDLLGVFGGFNYWMFAHATNFKIQFGATKKDGNDFGLAGLLQAQLLF